MIIAAFGILVKEWISIAVFHDVGSDVGSLTNPCDRLMISRIGMDVVQRK